MGTHIRYIDLDTNEPVAFECIEDDLSDMDCVLQALQHKRADNIRGFLISDGPSNKPSETLTEKLAKVRIANLKRNGAKIA